MTYTKCLKNFKTDNRAKFKILGLTWDKVSLEKRIIKLEAQDTEDRKPRTIPISQELLQILKSVPGALHDNHVFLYNGKPVESIKTGLIRACRDARIDYGRFANCGFVSTPTGGGRVWLNRLS